MPLTTNASVLFLLLGVGAMYSPRQSEAPSNDPKKYDQHANQWMREALDSRQAIEELKGHNDKLQRDVYALNSRVGLIYECLGEMGIVDKVGDLMQQKIRAFQQAQYARQNAPPSFANSPRQRKLSDAPKPDEGFICGSSAFQQTAAFSSSYEGQVGRDTFNRKNMLETEEAQYRDKYDIFGKPKLPSPKSAPKTVDRRAGDAIDSLLSYSGPPGGARQPPPLVAASSARSFGPR